MSEYDWPIDRAEQRDRRAERARYNAQLYGISDDETIEAARLEHRVAAQPAAGGGGGGGGGGGAAAEGLITSSAPRVDLPFLWLPIGPSVVLRGQASNHPRVSGRVRCLAVSPDGNRLYAGTGSGGLWYSRDGGASWRPLGGWADNPDPAAGGASASVFACGALLVRFGTDAVVEVAEAHDEVFIGTGELENDSSGSPGQSVGGVGLLSATGPARWGVYEAHWERRGPLQGISVNRIIPHPNGGNRLLLATTEGLWDATLGAEPVHDLWQRVADFPPNTPGDSHPARSVSDLAFTTGPPHRLWATVARRAAGDWTTAQLWSRDLTTPGAIWREITLPGNVWKGSTFCLGTTNGRAPVFVLGGGVRLWRVTGAAVPVVGRVSGIPPTFLLVPDPHNNDKSQSSYDEAVAVHPDDPTVVVIGGGPELFNGEWCAELHRLKITGTDANPVAAPTFAGAGIHADVHALVWSGTGPADRFLWVGCDGGVFRRALPPAGALGDGLARNDGLATLQPGFVATHARAEGHLFAGLQDNATIERVGSSVWEVVGGGDGGGLAYYPSAGYGPASAPPTPPSTDHVAIYQAYSTIWNGRLTPVNPPVRRVWGDSPPDHELQEDAAAAFYSGVAAVMSGGSTRRPRVTLGTYRVWFSENFGQKWCTLPSRSDPLDPHRVGGVNPVLDVPIMHGSNPSEDAQVVQCRWADADTLLVLCHGAVLLYKLTTHADGTATACAEPVFLDRALQPRRGSGHVEAAARLVHAVGSPTDIAVHRTGASPFPSCYVSRTGDPREGVPTGGTRPTKKTDATPPDPALPPGAARNETLWWFDGNHGWHATGLHGAPHGTQAPAYAVVCDGANPDIVYVGTAAGVWKGTMTIAAGQPSWAWEPFSNGLPEASVHDLSIFHDDEVHLLRAAIASRGVWEVDLAHPAHRPQTFVRVHAHDIRRRATSSLVDPRSHNATYRWDASPDILVRRADQPPANIPPGEADMMSHATSYTPSPMGLLSPAAGAVRQGPLEIDVLVHLRDTRVLQPNEIAVALLWQAFAPVPWSPGFTATDALAAAWEVTPSDFGTELAALFNGVLQKSEATAEAFQATWAPPAGWHLATPLGTSPPIRVAMPRPPDARTPRSVTFALDTTLDAAHPDVWPTDSNLLVVAVVSSSFDRLTAPIGPTTLRALTLASHHVAVRTVCLRFS